MLSSKSKYILPLIFFIKLGCVSHYRFQMQDQEIRERNNFRNRLPGQNIMDHLDDFVPQQGGILKRGSGINDTVIRSAITKIRSDMNNVRIGLLPGDYKIFLNRCGAMYGQGYRIFGRTNNRITNEEAANHIALIQNGFKEDCCTIYRKPIEQVGFYWLIASIDESDKYYIDTSPVGGNRVYSIDHTGNSRFFAENFSEFLNRFYDSFINEIQVNIDIPDSGSESELELE